MSLGIKIQYFLQTGSTVSLMVKGFSKCPAKIKAYLCSTPIYHLKAWHSTVGTVPTARHSTVRYSIVWYLQYGTSMAWHGRTWHRTGHPGTVQNGIAQQGMIQSKHGTAQRGTAWHGTIGHGTTHKGKAWQGTAQYLRYRTAHYGTAKYCNLHLKLVF